MAGAGGLEPPSAGTKTLCLTAWLRPKILNGIINGCKKKRLNYVTFF
jgi:hypothetical protein